MDLGPGCRHIDDADRQCGRRSGLRLVTVECKHGHLYAAELCPPHLQALEKGRQMLDCDKCHSAPHPHSCVLTVVR